MRAIFPPDCETQMVREFFGEGANGFFVEVGANDPYEFSQSWHLEHAGWSGVLVEPQPDLVKKLQAQRKAKVYPVACSSPENAGKTMRLHLAGPHSSFDLRQVKSTRQPEGSIDVQLMTLDAILSDAGAPQPIDFLSVDIEGHELEALSGFDFARWRPRLVLLEDLAMGLARHRYMRSRGYRLVRRTGLNAWYVPDSTPMRPSLLGRLQLFRKYLLALPFRRLREALRRLRHNR